MSQIIACKSCKSVLESYSTDCLECGSSQKRITLNFEEDFFLREQLKGKAKDHSKTGKRKEMLKFVDGNEQSANGQWVDKNQSVDYANDLYQELIIDEDGKTLRNVCESLKAHRDRGSAKPSRR